MKQHIAFDWKPKLEAQPSYNHIQASVKATVADHPNTSLNINEFINIHRRLRHYHIHQTHVASPRQCLQYNKMKS